MRASPALDCHTGFSQKTQDASKDVVQIILVLSENKKSQQNEKNRKLFTAKSKGYGTSKTFLKNTGRVVASVCIYKVSENTDSKN